MNMEHKMLRNVTENIESFQINWIDFFSFSAATRNWQLEYIEFVVLVLTTHRPILQDGKKGPIENRKRIPKELTSSRSSFGESFCYVFFLFSAQKWTQYIRIVQSFHRKWV